MAKRNHQNNVAVCAFEIRSAGVEVQLFPAGMFRARDGRPEGLEGWYIDDTAAMRLVTQAARRKTPYIIDYEHQTLNAETNGQPAPRSARFNTLQWRPGEGLFATDVEWTDRAKAYIDGDEYGFISPVFSFDRDTGEVLALFHAGLTNDPAIDGLAGVAARAAAKFAINPLEEEPMNEELLALFGLKKGATDDEIKTAVTALKAKADSVGGIRSALAIDEKTDPLTAIAVLKSADTLTPDPAKFVPIDVVKSLQTQVAALSTQINTKAVDDLISAAMGDGKLLPAQEVWARSLGAKDVEALKAYLDTAQPIAALRNAQTKGRPAGSDDPTGLTDDELAVCKSLGMSVEAFKAGKGEAA